MKKVKIRCQWCGKRFTYEREGLGRPPRYCDDYCRAEAKNEQARARVAAWRRRIASPGQKSHAAL